jgi:hypothetical protein
MAIALLEQYIPYQYQIVISNGARQSCAQAEAKCSGEDAHGGRKVRGGRDWIGGSGWSSSQAAGKRHISSEGPTEEAGKRRALLANLLLGVPLVSLEGGWRWR